MSLDAGQASITLDATDAKATSPATLTLRWTGDDHAAQAISVTGPAPAGLGWEPRGIAARVAGTEVTATIRSGAQVYVLHGKRGGRLAYADIPSYEDWSTIRFGATPEDPLSWVERSPAGVRVMLWSPGHPPRALSTLPVTATLPASRGGLPVLLDTASSTLLRVLPFPVRGEVPAPPAAETVPLDGWTDLGAREGFFLRLPVCGAKAQGAATTVYEPVTVRVDGVDERTSGAVVEVRAGTAGACIAGLRWAAGRDPGSSSLWHYRRVDADVVTQRAVAVLFHGEGRAVTCKLGEAGVREEERGGRRNAKAQGRKGAKRAREGRVSSFFSPLHDLDAGGSRPQCVGCSRLHSGRERAARVRFLSPLSGGPVGHGGEQRSRAAEHGGHLPAGAHELHFPRPPRGAIPTRGAARACRRA